MANYPLAGEAELGNSAQFTDKYLTVTLGGHTKIVLTAQDALAIYNFCSAYFRLYGTKDRRGRMVMDHGFGLDEISND